MTRLPNPAERRHRPLRHLHAQVDREGPGEGVQHASMPSARRPKRTSPARPHEGWTCLPERYDDGGFTGGNMDRPALQRLLADIAAGKVDCVVVYKIDRLSRSLLDFARMMEVFDQHHVSFVVGHAAIQYARRSMGRLMLNVLLSFAQFEREIIAERTRDKIAAARRKGQMVRRHADPGLRPRPERLEVGRQRGRGRCRCGRSSTCTWSTRALLPVVQELAAAVGPPSAGPPARAKPRGGRPFNKTNLHHLLTRVLYIGKVPHKHEVHAGEQPAIVDEAVWQRVQELLHRRRAGARPRQASGALLGGLVFCGRLRPGAWRRLTPARRAGGAIATTLCTHAQKNGQQACPAPSVPAAALGAIRRRANPGVGRRPRPAPRHGPRRRRCRPPSPTESERSRFPANALAVGRLGACCRPSAKPSCCAGLVQRIDYDGAAGKVRITFQPRGIQALAPTENNHVRPLDHRMHLPFPPPRQRRRQGPPARRGAGPTGFIRRPVAAGHPADGPGPSLRAVAPQRPGRRPRRTGPPGPGQPAAGQPNLATASAGARHPGRGACSCRPFRQGRAPLLLADICCRLPVLRTGPGNDGCGRASAIPRCLPTADERRPARTLRAGPSHRQAGVPARTRSRSIIRLRLLGHLPQPVPPLLEQGVGGNKVRSSLPCP